MLGDTASMTRILPPSHQLSDFGLRPCGMSGPYLDFALAGSKIFILLFGFPAKLPSISWLNNLLRKILSRKLQRSSCWVVRSRWRVRPWRNQGTAMWSLALQKQDERTAASFNGAPQWCKNQHLSNGLLPTHIIEEMSAWIYLGCSHALKNLPSKGFSGD